jgi:hypothetical protein
MRMEKRPLEEAHPYAQVIADFEMRRRIMRWNFGVG